jgi:tetratricopeptide (TPR) repeat protein
LNASCATALYFGAHIHATSGDPALAEEYAQRALRLSPFDPASFEAHVAIAIVRVRQRRYDEAAAYGAKAIQANPRFSVLYALQATFLALAGRLDEAKSFGRRLLELEPTFHVEPVVQFVGFAEPETREAVARGLRQAGLPE